MNYDYFKKFAPQQVEEDRSRANRTVIYTRVSSKDQVNTSSLSTQLNTCTQFALNNGFKVVKCFGGTYESAKVDEDRKEFKRMLEFVTEPTNKVSSIVVFNYDRFSRTGLQAIEIISILQKANIKVYSAISGIDPDSLEGKIMLTMTLLQANIQNVNKSLDTKRKMKAKLEAGIWPHNCPRGYSRDKNKKVYVNDDGKLLREAFDMLLQGHSPAEIRRYFIGKGLVLNYKRWTEIYRNPFYCGIMLSNLLDYKPVLGKHPPIVSISEFQRINGIIDERPYSKAGSDSITSELPLKIHLRCSECGEKFTGYVNKKKKKAYYICNGRDCRVNVSATKVNAGFVEYMQRLVPLDVSTAQIEQRLQELIQAVREFNQKETDKINEGLAVVQKKISSLADKLLVGTVSDDLFKEKLKELEEERQDLEESLRTSKIDLSNPDEIVSACIGTARRAASVWEEGSIAVKRTIQEVLFRKEIFYDKAEGVYRTPRLNSAIHLMNTITANYGNKKADNSRDFLELSALVPLEGAASNAFIEDLQSLIDFYSSYTYLFEPV